MTDYKAMRKLNKLIVLLLFISMAGNLMAQSAEKATAGTGKYRDMIYWLKWDMRKRADGSTPANSKIEEGDYVEFTAPESGMTYKVTVTNMSFPWNWENKPKVLKAGNYNNYWLNNFQAAYYWPCPGDGSAPCSKPWSPGGNAPSNWEDKKISLLVDKCEVIFDLKITASLVGSGIPIKDFAFIVAGSESLATPGGNPVREEYYSLEILPNEGETILQPDQIVQPVEAYKQVLNPGSDWSLKLESLFGTEPGTSTVKGAKLKVTNPNTIGGNNGNGQGDLLLAATHVEKVRVGLKGGGSQHIALGIIDLLDFGDAPNMYETDQNDPTTFARHYTLPSLGGELRTEDKTWTTEPSVEEFVQLEEPILGIGEVIDSEEEKQSPSAEANGDDVNGYVDDNGVVINDEDGIPGNKWFSGCDGPVKVHNHHHSKTAYLHVWVDGNGNGQFDSNEYWSTSIAPGFDDYKYVPFAGMFPNAIMPLDKAIMRFRVSYDADLGIGNLSTSGEVEDHEIEFMVPFVNPLQAKVDCDNATFNFTATNLPKTGWTIYQTGRKGSVLNATDATAVYTGYTETKIVALEQGSYRWVVSNNAPGCNTYTFNFIIIGDADCDGIPDNIDLDDDNDGILDTEEGLIDEDGDGIPDDRDDDTSTEMIEVNVGINPDGTFITQTVMKGALTGDIDGVINNPEIGRDTDNDGIPDYLDLDSDGDDCPDAIEGDENVKLTDLNTNGSINVLSNSAAFDIDTDGVSTLVNAGGAADNGGDQGQGKGISIDANINECFVKAKDDINQTPQGVAVSGNVLTNDDGTGKVTKVVVNGQTINVPETGEATLTLNGKGELKIKSDGTYTFTPILTFTGDVPTITYTIENGVGETDTAKLNIKVIPTPESGNNPPIAQNDTYTVEQGQTATVPVLANDSDPDGDNLTVKEVKGLDSSGQPTVSLDDTNKDVYVEDPSNPGTYIKAGTAKLVNGKIEFTPEADFTGDVPFDYTISDGNGGEDTAVATVTVLPSNTTNDVYANDDANTGNQGETLAGNILTNDNIEGTLSTLKVQDKNGVYQEFLTLYAMLTVNVIQLLCT